MKGYLYILAVFLVSSSVLAASIEMDSFKVYVDGNRVDTTFDDGQTILAHPGSTIEVQMRFKNNEDSTINVDVFGTLFDIEGTDIDKTADADVPADDRKTMVLEFFIPQSAPEDEFDLELEYKYTFNSTSFSQKRNLIVDVRKIVVAIEDILLNISRQVAESREKEIDLKGMLLNHSYFVDGWAECKVDLEKAETNGEYKSKYENETTQRQDFETKYTECDALKRNMVTSSDKQFAVEQATKDAFDKGRREGEDSIRGFGMFIGLCWLGWYAYNEHRKRVGGKGEGHIITPQRFGRLK